MASSSSSNSSSKLKSIMDTTSPDWSTLTKDLLISIANRLDSLGDTLRFRAVCNTFKFSIPAPKRFSPPRSDLNIPFPFEKHRHSGGHFVVISSTVYAFKSLTLTHETNQTLLVRAQKSPSGKVRLQNPLFETRLQLYSSSHNLPESLNLLDYHVKEIDKAYHLELVSPVEDKPLLDFFQKSSCFHVQ
ncbi:putative F-box protein At1g65770 [Pistacia vera]|uniref:putative F-box protein At1g65770 n=1 Tax=Pistacia vera TaxID=55513 RepID=UPI001262DDE5|nr:putative F-box protein At1g65770 [Pistacia vera]